MYTNFILKTADKHIKSQNIDLRFEHGDYVKIDDNEYIVSKVVYDADNIVQNVYLEFENYIC